VFEQKGKNGQQEKINSYGKKGGEKREENEVILMSL